MASASRVKLSARDYLPDIVEGIVQGALDQMGRLKVHKSGDVVPQSGIYVVLHSTPHMLIDHQIYIEGSRFRGCRTCPLGVLYRLEEQCIPTPCPNLTAAQGLGAC
jgi:hypothetical protein